ncbi:MAG TPA: hypothetical protein VGM92_05775 [Candidatus Kapabacteria bacterium]
MNYLPNLMYLKIYWRSGALKTLVFGLFAAALLTTGAMLSGCASSTTPSTTTSSDATLPDAVQANNSRDAADILATSMGTTSGGSGMIFNDAMTLAQGQSIPDAVVKTPSNDTTTVHIATVSRSFSKNSYSYEGTWTHTWTYYDANGNAMPKFIKGTTDKVVITSEGQHTVSTPRVGLADSSNGTWTLSNLIAEPDSATLNGTISRAGQTTKLQSGKNYTHSFTNNWTNDILVKVYDPLFNVYVSCVLGTGNSNFQAVGYRDSSFERQVSIVYHGDGSATLTVTRLGNGKTDTFTINGEYGIWLRGDHIG